MTDTAQSPAHAAAQALADVFDEARALATVTALCTPVMSGRSLGSAGHDRATRLLEDVLASYGLTPRLDAFPIREVMRLAEQPTCHADGPMLSRSLVHRAEYAEHPRSGPMPAPVTGTVAAAEDATAGQWAALLEVPQGDAFADLAAQLTNRGAVGILTPQNADGSGFLTKRVQGAAPVELPVVAVRPDLLSAAVGGELTAHVQLLREPATGTNIIATLPGSNPDARPVLLTAHYDGVGSDPELHFPCAGDNASGTAVLCEAARVLSQAAPLPRPVIFALVDAEELGTLGSRHHAKQLTGQSLTPDVLNVDMAGKFNGKVAIELGPADPQPKSLIAALDASGRQLRIPLYAAPVSSDNRRYAQAGFAAAGIGLGAAHYHSPLDAVERIDPDALRKAGQLVLATIYRLTQP
ncbi:M28 family metallopeptidase [Streptomyces sp. NBC_00154]|uniref:M28 family metallopeptidase n=1 Tax=Streptomyces sp. NBC_00154 TaxID=2975670 RepID=UPI00224F8BFE|nr:M28 family metallopeptidase [Streptomyces sp. NBC_00154]MCX5316131.1 M28 family metallopeptidase [Streptomyces sp. NBC_00154]